MNAAKLVTALVWLISIGTWIIPWPGWVGTAFHWAGPFMAVAHVIEFAAFRETFAKAGGSAAAHFANTFVFGMFHINEVKAAVEGGSSDAQA